MTRYLVLAGLIAAAQFVVASQSSAQAFQRTPDGRPDLSGTYDVATLTPFERPERFGTRRALTDEEAEAIRSQEAARLRLRATPSAADREAPPEGGDGSAGAAGNVGGYNTFWIDRGEGNFKINGEWRTSILIDPPNGRRPALSAEGQRRADRFAAFRRENSGTAWWLDMEVGPYDDMELRPLQERCLLSRARSGPPITSGLYNNLKRVVQTETHVMILAEQIHDARIIRIGGELESPDLGRWMGDSVGRWEGDTLVVETANFRDVPGDPRAVHTDLRATERWTPNEDGSLLYQFTIRDPSYSAPYSGETLWPRTSARVFEYACHEGNYSFGGIMRGARVLERDAGSVGDR